MQGQNEIDRPHTRISALRPYAIESLEPRLLMVSLIGLTVFPLAAQPIWRAIYPAEDITADVLRRHVLALLLRGLELGDAR